MSQRYSIRYKKFECMGDDRHMFGGMVEYDHNRRTSLYKPLFSDAPPSPILACQECGAESQLLEEAVYRRSKMTVVHPSEQTMVWESPNGEIRIPMSNDAPMPSEYRAQGYRELRATSLRELESIEKRTGKISFRAHYDGHNGPDGQ